MIRLHYFLAFLIHVLCPSSCSGFYTTHSTTAVDDSISRFTKSIRYGETIILHSTNKDDSMDITNDQNYQDFVTLNRRKAWQKVVVQTASIAVGAAALVVLTRPAVAKIGQKSRTDGYEVQKTEDEWKLILSPLQYEILREGGTERPGFSILEGEKRPGIFKCAGCGTSLFITADKFNSGTGWPSFARALDGVEIENVDPITASLGGAELRCKTCGGHLGDVFRDGFIFQGTEAAITGKRFCIDGAALIFYPDDDNSSSPVRGDQPAKSRA